jgi:hypothetical protein
MGRVGMGGRNTSGVFTGGVYGFSRVCGRSVIQGILQGDNDTVVEVAEVDAVAPFNTIKTNKKMAKNDKNILKYTSVFIVPMVWIGLRFMGIL